MKFQMLISIKISNNSAFFLGSDKPRMLFFLLMNVKMPKIVGILTFISRKIFMLSSVEHEKSFITSGLSTYRIACLTAPCPLHKNFKQICEANWDTGTDINARRPY